MGSKVSDADTLRGRFHDVPNRLGRDSIAPDLSRPTYSPEDRTTIDASRRGPLIDGAFRPHWNRNCTDVFSFANQVAGTLTLGEPSFQGSTGGHPSLMGY